MTTTLGRLIVVVAQNLNFPDCSIGQIAINSKQNSCEDILCNFNPLFPSHVGLEIFTVYSCSEIPVLVPVATVSVRCSVCTD